MTTNPTPDRTPYCHKIRYGITGAPVLDGDEMDGSHAPGVGIAPKLIELVYSPGRAGKPAHVDASVTGDWTRFGEPDDFGGQVTTHFKSGPDGWPEWLAEEARLHDPAADQTAEFELRGTAEIRAAVYAEVADRLKADAEEGAKDGFTRIYRRAAADRVRVWANEVAAEAPAPETQQPVKPTSHTWTFEVCYDGDKWHGCGPTYDDSVFGNAHETAREDFQHRAENDKQRRRFRMIRATTTYVVEAEHQAAAVSAGVQPGTEARPRETVHGCPPDGSGLTPCCGRTPFELPRTDRISSEAPITCTGKEA